MAFGLSSALQFLRQSVSLSKLGSYYYGDMSRHQAIRVLQNKSRLTAEHIQSLTVSEAVFSCLLASVYGSLAGRVVGWAPLVSTLGVPFLLMGEARTL